MSRQDILDTTRAGSVERQLFDQIDLERLPRHIAIIMDGNGRWAKGQGLPRVEGHRAGIASVRETVETCARLDIPVLTLYAFSVENWKRPRSEVDVLMMLLKQYLRLELSTLMKNDIRFKVLGRMPDLPDDVVSELEAGMERTRDNHGLLFNIALNYGGAPRSSTRVKASSTRRWRAVRLRRSTKIFSHVISIRPASPTRIF